MNPLSRTPKPLSATEYYILLALAEENLHRYAIRARIYNYSLCSVLLDYTQLARLIRKFLDEVFIEPAGDDLISTPSKPRHFFTITEHGRLRLHEETLRLEHALKIAKRLGAFDART